jgi:carboxyl-terminal processing protease
MVARLGDDHSVFLNPKEAADEEAEFAGENNYVGVGVLSAAVPERSRVTIVVVFPNSPAEEAGLKPHDSILAVDGLPILEGDIDRRTNMRGPEGTQVTLTVQSPGGEPRLVALTRRRVLGSEPVPYSHLTSPAGKRVGYILLPTLANDTIIEKVKDALLALTAGGALDGLILDNRQNPGGTDNVTRGTLSYFTKGTVGYFINRQGRNAFNISGQDVNGSQTVPLVVLVGKGTVSFGEIFSGILQDEGRASIIGEQTDGNVEILWGYDFTDGSRAWLAHDTFRPTNHPEANWEESGIIPDIAAASNWDEVDTGSDPAIKACLDYFDQKK